MKIKNVHGGELLTIEQSLAKHLYKQRSLLGLSQEGVAGRCHISRAAYSNFESGKRTPSLKLFVRICSVLYMPYQQILDEASEQL